MCVNISINVELPYVECIEDGFQSVAAACLSKKGVTGIYVTGIYGSGINVSICIYEYIYKCRVTVRRVYGRWLSENRHRLPFQTGGHNYINMFIFVYKYIYTCRVTIRRVC